MGLANYKAATREFPIGDKPEDRLVFRGLSLVEITTLIRQHLPDMEALARLVGDTMSGRKELTAAEFDAVAIAMFEQAPGFVANLIVLAEEGGDKSEAAVAGAMRLPGPLQIEVLCAIADLTFMEVGGIKKAIERIAALMKNDKLTTLAKKALK